MARSSASQHPVPPLAGALPPDCQRDLTALRRVVRTTLEDASPLDPVSPADFRHVLVTGATGFVGRFLVRDLLAHESELTVHCVVRAESVERGFERLRANMEHAETWDDAFTSRIHIYAGDVSQPRFGLSGADFGRLCREIDAVYHLAADPNLIASYRSLRQVNALGVRDVLRLCLSIRLKHLFHVSTMGVFPEYVFSFAGEYRDCHIGDHAQPDLGRMKRTMPLGLLGYSWSKLVAEQAVLFAHQVGLPTAVFRFGQTTMASTGYAQSDTPPQLVFAAAVQVGMIPQGFTMRATDDPADTLTRMCTDISMNVNRRFTVYSCCNTAPSYRAMRLAEFGLDYPEVPYADFKRACQAHGDASPMARSW
ncbi:MAG: NAD-dependent epimerase/dehydratase family protein, partial [Gemmatimonadetes bacterium]|nr:NAD-dependent epimerase/dehydratase family protein [Gemmatimonadota bacterium]